MDHQTDLYAIYKARPSIRHRLRQFIKQSGIELTIAIVGIFIGLATVLVTNKVGTHQEILQASRMTDGYFNGISDLFAKSMDENPRIDLVIIARTQAILEDLDRLNKPDKLADIIIFLSHLQPNLFHKQVIGQTTREKFVDLSGLNLQGSWLSNINLERATLRRADLSDCDLHGTNLQSANLRKAQLRNTNLKNANLKDADLTNANLKGAIIYQTVFDNANLENAIWVNGIRCKSGSIGYCKLT